MNKKIQKNGKKFLLGFVVLMIGILVLINFSKDNLKTNFIECPSSSELVNIFQEKIENNKVEILPYEPERGGHFYWKWDLISPERGYSNQTGFDGSYIGSESEIDNVVAIYNNSVEPKFLNLGFIKDGVNSYTKNYSIQNKLTNYGYKNGKVLLKIYFSRGDVYDPQDGTRIVARCGVINDQYEKIYNDLLRSKNVIASIKKLYKTSNLNDTGLSISDVYSNELIGVSIGDVEVFFHKENNDWVEVLKSQNGPSCSMLKKYDIKGNFDCF